jgi:rhodanese-related sulfurtransferase
MFSILLQRAIVLGCLGLLAGGVHSSLRAPVVTKSEKEAVLRAQLAGSAAATQGEKASAAASGVSASSVATQDAGTQTAGAAAKLGLEISLADAKRLFDGGALFVDARRREEYVESHVEGAFLLPADIFAAPQPPLALSMMDPSATLVIYCGGGACDASHNTAFQLSQRGFKAIHIMTDGLPAWSNAGYPVASGAPFYEAGSNAGGGS